MCYIIEADCVLVYVFVAGKRTVTIRDLNKVRARLESEFNNVFIDISNASIYYAIEHRPDLFRFCEDSLVIHDDQKKLSSPEYIEEIFNWRIPLEYRERFVETIRMAFA